MLHGPRRVRSGPTAAALLVHALQRTRRVPQQALAAGRHGRLGAPRRHAVVRRVGVHGAPGGDTEDPKAGHVGGCAPRGGRDGWEARGRDVGRVGGQEGGGGGGPPASGEAGVCACWERGGSMLVAAVAVGGRRVGRDGFVVGYRGVVGRGF